MTAVWETTNDSQILGHPSCGQTHAFPSIQIFEI